MATYQSGSVRKATPNSIKAAERSATSRQDAAYERLWFHALNTDECHGIVTRGGVEEPCEKPTTCIIDDPEGGPWASCIWHAHRYGTDHMVTLADIRSRGIPSK